MQGKVFSPNSNLQYCKKTFQEDYQFSINQPFQVQLQRKYEKNGFWFLTAKKFSRVQKNYFLCNPFMIGGKTLVFFLKSCPIHKIFDRKGLAA